MAGAGERATKAGGRPTRPPTRVRRLVFALCCAASFLLYLHRYTWGFIKVELLREHDWSPATVGFLDGLFSASYAAGQVPAGLLADLIGPHAVLSTTVGLWSLALAATVLAASVPSLAAVRLLFGAAQAGCYPTLNKVTKLWFPIEERTRLQGWIATFFGRGGGAASNVLFGSVLLGVLGMDWRTATFLFAAAGLVFAGLFAALFRNSPAEHPWSNAEEAALVQGGDPDAGVFARRTLAPADMARSLTLWMLLFEQFAAAFVDNLFVYWTPIFLVSEWKTSLEGAGWMSALPLFAGALGGLAAGYLQTFLIARFGSYRWGRSLTAMGSGLFASLFMWGVLAAQSAGAVVLAFCLVKFFSDFSQPTVWATTTDIGGQGAASVFAWVNTSGSIAGFVAGPAMGGLIGAYGEQGAATAAGWSLLFGVMAVIYLAASLSWLLIDCTKRIGPPLAAGAET